MAHPIGFDLRAHMRRTRRFPTTEKPRIKIDDVVRPKSGWQVMRVNEVDGNAIYCDDFLDPFNADGLEFVPSH